MNEDVISKIKAKAYENVNKKLEEERQRVEDKINNELNAVEEILKYIKNKLIFKKVGNNWSHKYTLVTEEMFFEDYNSEPKNYWDKGIEINHKRENKWDCFIKVNGNYYYDVRYIISNYEEDFNALDKRLNSLKEQFSEIERLEERLLEEEPRIKKLLEQYQEIDLKEEEL